MKKNIDTKSIAIPSTLAAHFLQEKRSLVKPSTVFIYEMHLRCHILPWFTSFEMFTEDEVQSFILHLLDGGLSGKTAKDCLVVLKMFARQAAKIGLAPFPDWDIAFPTTDRRPQLSVLSLQEQKTLQRYCRDHFSLRHVGILLSLSTGMRIGEVCALRWKDMDFQSGTVSVHGSVTRDYTAESKASLVIGTTKTASSERIIPLSSSLSRYMKPLSRVFTEDAFVLSGTPFPLDPRLLRVAFSKALKESGIRQIRFHGLRHTFATRCIDAGCDVKTVSALLGHSSVSTTMDLYVHPDLEQKRRAIERVARKTGE